MGRTVLHKSRKALDIERINQHNTPTVSNLRAEGCNWYAVRVRNRSEQNLSLIFREKLGLQSKVPLQKTYKLHNGIKVINLRPILATYVFILTNLKMLNWRMLFSPSGVFNLVSCNGRPAAIPDEQISILEKLGQSERHVYEVEYGRLQPADRVEVIDGPLKGALGNFIKTNDRTGRFVLSLDIFRRTLITELEADFIKPY